jgi:hypothetical protein
MNIKSISGHVKSNHICVLGLTPFIYRFYDTGSIASLIIYTNGIIFHLFLPKNVYMKCVDTFLNIILITYVNIQALNMYIFMWTCFGTMVFILNVPVKGYEIIEPLLHITFVQGAGIKCLSISGF